MFLLSLKLFRFRVDFERMHFFSATFWMQHLVVGEGVCEGRHDKSHRSSSQEEAPSVGVSEIAKRGGWTGGWGGMILGWGLGRRPLVAVLMALLSLTVMVRQASSLTCYTTKYTVRNFPLFPIPNPPIMRSFPPHLFPANMCLLRLWVERRMRVRETGGDLCTSSFTSSKRAHPSSATDRFEIWKSATSYSTD
jgi:hypothetical protein